MSKREGPYLSYFTYRDEKIAKRKNRSSAKSTVGWFLLWALLIAIFV